MINWHSATYLHHLLLFPLGSRKRKTKNPISKTPLHFGLWIKLSFTQSEALAKDLEGKNEAVAIS